jgi:urease accessory protein
LRLLTPANHGSASWVYTSSYGGGFVDGDRLDLEVEVTRGAAAYLSTQAATKVYRSPSGTHATLQARVDEDALFILAPDPVVCFAGARYRQEQRFAIAPGAGLVVLDAIVSGRHAAGERWAFLEYQSLIELSIGGRMAIHDPIALRAADGNLAGRLGRFEVLATVVIAGTLLRDETVDVLAACGREPLSRRADLVMAASPLGQDGCIVRLGATSTEQLTHRLRALLHFLPSRLDDDPWRRKW